MTGAQGGSDVRMAGRILALLTAISWMPTGSARAQLPDPSTSYFVVQSGPVATPTEGSIAQRLLRQCPNTDGGTSLPNNVRLKIKLIDGGGANMAGVAATDIYIRFNGGTAAQGFFGPGADSIIANGTYNVSPSCPLLQYVYADAATNSDGVTYITLRGADPLNPGVALRDPNRKWGHYDSDIPVYARGVPLQGRNTTNGTNGEYVLRIKNIDFQGGLGTALDKGEAVSSVDYNSLIHHIGDTDPLSYWRDLDGNGVVGAGDLNIIMGHLHHDCDTPFNP